MERHDPVPLSTIVLDTGKAVAVHILQQTFDDFYQILITREGTFKRLHTHHRMSNCGWQKVE